MHKRLLLSICLCMLLVLLAAFVADANTTQAKGERVLMLPDLVVKSVRVTSDPVIFTGARIVLIPLEITIANIGSGTNKDFNLGAEGWALDGNVQGTAFSVPGAETMPDRDGILVHGMPGIPLNKTYRGLLLLTPSGPNRSTMQPGTRWRIRAMVDYTLDPDDVFGYRGSVIERNESNNEMEIIYPATSV